MEGGKIFEQNSGISSREIAGARAAVIASQRVGAKRRPTTGSAKQSSFLYCCSMVASRSLSPLVIAATRSRK